MRCRLDRRVRRQASVLALAWSMATCGCAGRRALCETRRDQGAGAVTAREWMSLLLHGYEPATGRAPSPTRDCTGAQVRWDGPSPGCEDGVPATTRLPDRPLAAADVVAADVDRRSTLVWIATTGYAAGDAAGPVALVERSGAGLRVVAAGVLRSYPKNAKLKLERMGGAEVLVAEGDACAPGAGPCARIARVVPLVGSRFAPSPLLTRGRRCAAPALFELSRSERRRSRGGWELAELSSALAFGTAGFTVEQQVLVQELADGPRGTPARVLRRARATRTVQWANGTFVAGEAPLWERMTAAAR